MGRFHNIWNRVPEAYKGVVLFLLCLFGSNMLWELTIDGDETSLDVVSFCGNDISWLFYDVQLWFANITHRTLTIMGVYSQLIMENVRFANGHCSKIITGCTAIKQLYMMTVILLFSRGRLVHKSWYWLVSMSVLIVYNVLRLTLLSYIVRDYRDMFEFMHVYVLKYIFYGLMFVLWVVWDEWLRKSLTKIKAD